MSMSALLLLWYECNRVDAKIVYVRVTSYAEIKQRILYFFGQGDTGEPLGLK